MGGVASSLGWRGGAEGTSERAPTAAAANPSALSPNQRLASFSLTLNATCALSQSAPKPRPSTKERTSGSKKGDGSASEEEGRSCRRCGGEQGEEAQQNFREPARAGNMAMQPSGLRDGVRKSTSYRPVRIARSPGRPSRRICARRHGGEGGDGEGGGGRSWRPSSRPCSRAGARAWARRGPARRAGTPRTPCRRGARSA
jgi:hypothetical protein